MLRKECKYNPTTDINNVQEGLSVDLVRALTEGVIQDTGEIPYHNDIEDPTTISGRVNDVFEAIDADRSLSQSMANKPQSPSQTQTVSTPKEGEGE